LDFHRLDDHNTRITLTMDVEITECIERRAAPTGAWRGSVEQDDVSG
jgi:hypothetical protein